MDVAGLGSCQWRDLLLAVLNCRVLLADVAVVSHSSCTVFGPEWTEIVRSAERLTSLPAGHSCHVPMCASRKCWEVAVGEGCCCCCCCFCFFFTVKQGRDRERGGGFCIGTVEGCGSKFPVYLKTNYIRQTHNEEVKSVVLTSRTAMVPCGQRAACRRH